MYLHELIDVAEKGTVLRHPLHADWTIRLVDRQFVWDDGSPVGMYVCYFDDRWEIVEPALGACEFCQGLGWKATESKMIPRLRCPVCNGTGKEEVPAESIVPDLCCHCHERAATHTTNTSFPACSFCKQCADEMTGKTPVVSGLMPGCETWEWDSETQVWVSEKNTTLDPECLANPNSGWTGRYGYRAEAGRVFWTTTPRALKRHADGLIYDWSVPKSYGYYKDFHGLGQEECPVWEDFESVAPDYIEMKKETGDEKKEGD